MLKSFILTCLVIVVWIGGTYSVAIFRDSEVLKKSQRAGRQLNDLYYEDEYPISPYRESRWESAEWPQHEELMHRGGDDSDDNDESGDRPYNWFYYNKYINNGPFNHLYNGPKADKNPGMGHSENNPPRILPRPAPSFRRSSLLRKENE